MSSRPIDIFRGWSQPFRDLARWQNDLDKMMQETWSKGQSLDLVPSCELEETKENFVLKFEMPGLNKEQVKIEMEGNLLTVSAERKDEKVSESKKRHYSEFKYGSYYRSFSFPTPVDDTKVDARFQDGVLTVTVPKSETGKTKQVKIQ